MKVKRSVTAAYTAMLPALALSLILLSGCKKDPDPVIPTVKTVSAATGITATAATAGGEAVKDGDATVTSRGICWATSTEPTTAGSKTVDGAGLGVFTSELTGLTPGIKYYLRAYAVNSVGTAYGEEISFTTLSGEAAISTTAADNITATSARSGGNVSTDGGADITVRGVCWGTTSGPTVDGDKTSDGSGTGEFTSELTGLTPATTYYIRGYATNSIGTSYGEEISFTTLSVEAAISTSAVGNITFSTARSGGNVSDDGGAAVTARGVCWSTSSGPTVNGNKTSDGSGTGEFISELTGLSPATKYYVRAYAVNSVGTAYGEEISFTTIYDLMNITPGTLQAAVESNGLESASSLTLGGSIDQRDFAYMKSMVDSRSLKSINLVGVTVAAYGSYPANEVPASAFDGSTKLTSFVFPAQITSIGERAFYNCSGLTGSLTIGSGVQTIGEYAFYNCSGFTGSLVIPDNVTSIGEYAFYYCFGFKGSLTIGSGLQAIENAVFYYCTNFTGSLTIPGNITSIGSEAFHHCVGFTGLTIENGVTSIGNSAFYNCYGFTGSLDIPDSATSIGNNAFYSCKNFTGSLTIGNNVQTIGKYAFFYCTGFAGSLTIGSGVQTIDIAAFYNCKSFTGTLVIPDNVTSIMDSAFDKCDALSDIKVAWAAPITYNVNMLPIAKTVYVPAASVSAYESASGWSSRTIVGY